MGGRHGDAASGDPVLVVRVAERAVEGAATAAVIAAVAEALGARRSAVRLVTGQHSRTKVLEIDPEPPEARDRLAALLATA